MKKALALAVTVVLIFTVLGALPIHGESEIYDSVLRLHVLANSDSKEDQELKLKVRDAILEASGELLFGISTRDEAALVIRKNIDRIEAVAQNTVACAGYDYAVNVTLTEEEYPTRSYESLCFPSGEYLSLRVMIGDAVGQNWWCVLFPPLCLSAASARDDSFDGAVAVGLTDEQYRLITDTEDAKYTIRFKILESIQNLK